MRPARRSLGLLGAGFLLALLPALGMRALWPLLPGYWGLLAVVLALDAILSPRSSRLRWELDIPEALYVGGSSSAVMTLRLPSRRSLPAEVALDLSDDLRRTGPVRGRVASTPLELRWSLTPTRRGTARVERAWIRYRSPLRLWWWQRRYPVDRELPVLPNLPLVQSTAIRFFADREFRAGRKIERYQGDGTEFEALKEFLVGDDHRTIDWKSSARHRSLLCRQFRAERNHQVVLAVDTGHLMSEPLHGIPKLDHALNAALVLAYVCLRSGDRVGLYSFDARVGPGIDPLGGTGAMRTLIQATARLRYSTDETNFTLGLTRLAARLRRRSLIILLTDFVDTVTAELMLENLHRMGRRHLVVFVSIRDPLLGRVASEEPRTSLRLSRAVVAHSLLRDREVVHRRLRRVGVQALDVEPERIGPALINRYLDVKRREMV